jgi:hypothetical protein
VAPIKNFLFIAGIELEGGRGNSSFPVEEGFGKPWVSERFIPAGGTN